MSEDSSTWRWLHPASVVVNLLPRSIRVLRGLWPLLLAFLWRGAGTGDAELWGWLIDAALVGVFFAATVGGTVLHFLTLRYRVHDGRLEIRTGLLNRKVRTIDPARIQNLELVRSISHKVSGLVEVRIETASGKEVEGLLSALSEAQALDLQRRLEALRALHVPDETDEPAPPLVRNGLLELFIYSATAARLGAVAVALGLAFEAYTWVNPEQVRHLPMQAAGWQGMALLVLLFTGTWLAGLVTTTVRHWGFALSKVGDRLVVEGGLTTRRRLELPLTKVQVVHSSQTLPRRWAGFSTFTVETAAARTERGGTERTAAMVPYLASDRLAELTAIAVPQLDLNPWTADLLPPHKRALVRSIGRSMVQWIALIVASSWFFGPWTLAIAPLGIALPIASWLDWRHQGWLVTDRTVVARRGFWNRRITVLSRSRLQSASARDNLILRRLGLGQVVLHAAGTTVRLPLMSWTRAQQIATTLAHSAGRRLPPSTPPTGDAQQRVGRGEGDDEPDDGRQEHEAHEQGHRKHDPVSPVLVEQRAGGGDDLERYDSECDDPTDEHDAGEHAHLAVKPLLPEQVEPPLHEQHDADHRHHGGEEEVDQSGSDA